MTRQPIGGRIDRSHPLSFTFDGRAYTGYRGDTLASALLAAGVHQITTSITYGRPRGVTAAGVEDSTALVQVDAPYAEPMVSAATVELCEGLAAHGVPGVGRLPVEPDAARYDAMHAHCDVLVVGAGPSGLEAAVAAVRDGARVVLVDDQPEPGGRSLGRAGGPPESVAAAVAELAGYPDGRRLARTTAFGHYDDGFVLALERRTDHRGAAPTGLARHRIWRIRAGEVVLATGAHERPIVFADNDRPGIMLATAGRTYLNRYAVRAGDQVVVFTTNDTAYAAALELADAGSHVTIIDPRPDPDAAARARCAAAGVEVRPGHVVTGTDGSSRVSAAHVRPVSGGTQTRYPCDLLLVSGGWNPAVQLYAHAGGRLRYDLQLGGFVPDGQLARVRVVGSAAGESAGLGRGAPPLWRVAGELDDDTRQFVDLQRDATVHDVLRATGAGLRSVEHVKRYTTIGTAHDQGKTSGVLAAGVVAEALGIDIAELGTTTFRPPYVPVSFAALAGRDRDLHDPIRVTALHQWHVEHAARFENVGQWKRPWYYPQPGEDMTAAVLRECRAARTGVALMDGSTLGKIDVRGADAGEFLDRLYTNMMSPLKVGSARYGVMCGVDGMVIDDGTVIRVAEQEFLLTTTTGNAAKILDWMEEWHQTEWPELDVWLTSVTDHWVTVPLVGPQSRDVLALVAPALDVSAESFGFMTWRDATVAGLSARVCRISFSGELAYEINVNAYDGLALWTALMAAGEPYGITPYGTETMHVLRAEKGFPIIGQDTDGTITPQDLGLSWVVSKKKPDFVGKRSHARADNNRPDRKQLVGLLPEDPEVLLAEGAQLIAAGEVPAPPVPMFGHVTSSYRSAALDRTFALALLKGGRDRIGERWLAWHDGVTVPVTVTEPVLYDPEGARRDG
jgi:sarcosine oxidase, subunit alpha